MVAIVKTVVGLNIARDAWSGAQNSKMTYFAWGSSTATPTIGDTQLGTEVGRKKVTSYTTGSTGELLPNCYLSPTDAVGANIQEIGIFAGNSATASLNTGVLIGHALYPHGSKLSTESIQLQLDAIIS